MSFRVVLAGFHWTGVKVLEHLLTRNDIRDLAVFTHDQSNQEYDLSPICKKESVFCTTKPLKKENIPFIPDIISSVYYRNIIKKDIIDACNGKIFNAHPSLLPRHRGCSSVPWSIIDGDTVTGISYHYIDEGIDTGNIILQASVPIYPNDTQKTLFDRCMQRCVEFWPAAFTLVAAGFPGVPQMGIPSYHRRGAPEEGRIDPHWPLEKIERFIRAMTFPPLPYATYRGQEVQNLEDFLALSKE